MDTTALAERLLPCPWCGEPLSSVSVSERSEPLSSVSVSERSTFRWRKVDGCCTDGPEIRHDTMADDQAAAEVESRRCAIEAWNTRAPATVTDEDVDRACRAFYGPQRWEHMDGKDAVRSWMRAALESFANKETTDE